MSIHSGILSSDAVRFLPRVLFCCALAAGTVSAQAPGSANEELSGAMERLNKGEFFNSDVDRLAKAGVVAAIPAFEKQFALTGDAYTKGAIASGLVRLGDKDAAYWEYLVKEAAPAVSSDAPSPNGFDLKGKLVAGSSPEFLAWAKAHNLSEEAATEEAGRRLPSRVAFLGESGDRRAIPLLRQALASPNYLIQAFAALGLSELGDKDSIPLIIDACRRAPADAASGLAMNSLLRFNDSRAQRAAELYLPRDAVESVRRERHIPALDPSGK